MSLESTIICMDSSDYMRNGDFEPSRFVAQLDAITVVCRSKARANPENTVGLLTLSNVQVIVPLTSDVRKIYSRMPKVELKGDVDLNRAIRVAHLALKHRQGKTHKMRIVVFIGSPFTNEQSELIQLAKKLKKEKVNVDIVNFGEDANVTLLEVFINTLNGKEGNGNHLITIPSGCELSDIIMTSPILCGSNVGQMDFEFGVDGAEDPELLLALRMSMDEQRQMQAEERRANQNNNMPAQPVNNNEQQVSMVTQNSNVDTMSEEEQIALAMSMSMESPETVPTESSENNSENILDNDEELTNIVNNSQFLQAMMENLSGVDDEDMLEESERSSDEKKNKK